MKKNYHWVAALCVLVVCLPLCFAAMAWDEPEETPPAGNVEEPINTGADAQTKAGDLSLGGNLNVASDSASGRFCLDDQCCSSWQECAAFGGGGDSGKLTLMSDVPVDGYDKYQCSDNPMFGTCSSFDYSNYWCPPGNCVIASFESVFLNFTAIPFIKVCAESGYELLVESSSQYDFTDCCKLDGGAALSDFTKGLYACNDGTWTKISD